MNFIIRTIFGLCFFCIAGLVCIAIEMSPFWVGAFAGCFGGIGINIGGLIYKNSKNTL